MKGRVKEKEIEDILICKLNIIFNNVVLHARNRGPQMWEIYKSGLKYTITITI